MRNFLLLSTLIFLVACAGFREGGVSSIDQYPQLSKKVSLALNIDHATILNGNRITNENIKIKLKEKFLERYKKSTLFSDVNAAANDSDYTLEILWENYGEMNPFLSVLTGLTLYIIPSSSKDTNIVKAKLTNNLTKKTTEVTFQDSVTMWQEILLLPCTIFKNPFVEANNMQVDLIDNLIMWTSQNVQN